MTPWFIATEQFSPANGETWHRYIAWSGLTQLTELVSLDPILCPPTLKDIRHEYWPHIVNEDYMLGYFTDLEFLRSELAGAERTNLLCVIRNPTSEPPKALVQGFEFVGYDLVDVQNSASALTNCGGFPDVFSNTEICTLGLLTDFNRAAEVQELLRSRHPEEAHAKCHLWAIYLSSQFGRQ